MILLESRASRAEAGCECSPKLRSPRPTVTRKGLSPQEFIAQYREQAALVINVSGGKDSTRMLGFLRSQFPTIPAYCVMADTGFEHVRPVSAVDWSRQLAIRFGLELHVVRNPNKIYLDMIRRRGKFPSAQFRQ